MIARILIVDDELAIRSSLSAFLEDAGYVATACESAEEALASAREMVYDLAVIDIRLQGKNGAEFVREVREMNPEMKSIIFTGSTDSEIEPILEQAQVRVDKVLHKPLGSLNDLTSSIQELLPHLHD